MKKHLMYRLLFSSLILPFAVACNSLEKLEPLPTLANTPIPKTAAPTASATRPTIPTFTITPTPKPNKDILLQFVSWGGDRGEFEKFSFLGGATPQFVLYTDGHFVTAGYKITYRETYLSVTEICALLTQIESAGFFQIRDDVVAGESSSSIYDPSVDLGLMPSGFSVGVNTIQINGEHPKMVSIDILLAKYLIPEVQSAYQIIKNYMPKNLKPYQAERLMLWVQKGRGDASDKELPIKWAPELPSLQEILNSKIGNQEQAKILVKPEYISLVNSLFSNGANARLFLENGQEFYVMSRPLLPHETPQKFPVLPYTTSSFALPFKCK